MRFVLHGTHSGNLFGIPATGSTVRVTVNVVLAIADGRVTRLPTAWNCSASVVHSVGMTAVSVLGVVGFSTNTSCHEGQPFFDTDVRNAG